MSIAMTDIPEGGIVARTHLPAPSRVFTRFNAATRARILSALKAGSYLNDAAIYAQIDPRTIFTWLRRGQDEEGIEGSEYYAFFVECQQAIGEAEVYAITQIQKAMKTQWQAAAWFLERKSPGKWGRSDKLRVTDERTEYQKEKDDPQLHARIVEASDAGLFRELAEGARERGVLRETLRGDDPSEPLDTDYADAEATTLPPQ